jgi:diaminopimelate decarboxylase
MTLEPGLLIALARAHDTPYYLYDLDAVSARIRAVRGAFGEKTSLLYAVKANPNPALLRGLAGAIDGLDVSSLGEIDLALRAGWPASKLSFTGPGKRAGDVARAIDLGVARTVVESEAEIELVARSAAVRGCSAGVLLRINPPERVHAFAVPATGSTSPFGIDDHALAGAAAALVRHAAHLGFEGLHVHAGSQCRSAAAFAHLADRMIERAERLARDPGLVARTLDFGGGFGVTVRSDERPLDLGLVASAIRDRLTRLEPPPRASFELGRYVVADAGVYVVRVVSVKRSYGTAYAVLDGGFNHLLSASSAFGDPSRPRAPIVNLSRPDAPREPVTLVGPLCTPLDVFQRDLVLPSPAPGDLLAFQQAGAYGYTLSPLLFLGHDTPVELLCSNGVVEVVRRRKSAIEWLDADD